jgi:hypothetical protein
MVNTEFKKAGVVQGNAFLAQAMGNKREKFINKSSVVR